LFITLLIFSSCKKDISGSTPVQFTATTYENLGTFDDSGKPNYLVTRDAISSNLLSYIASTLPEKTDLRMSNPELLTTKAIADITITQSSDVFITFVSQGASLRNAVAFYTYSTSTPPKSAKDIRKIIYIFPNAGLGTTLQPGDKVKIGRFEPGNSIGFVILQDAWNSTSKTLNNDVVHFCSNDVLNPENDPSLKKHAVLINYPSENKVLIGFEDLDRSAGRSDHDFNDIVLYATITP
jgi:hypothetical protein